MMLILCVFWAALFVWQIPTFVLGLLVGPLVRRQQFLIEFLYPSSLGRWAHLFLVRLVSKSRLSKKSSDKNRGLHSRALETRVEVVPGRVYIHPLPQLLDNLGYLVVCLPDENAQVSMLTEKNKNSTGGKVTVMHRRNSNIIGFVVDCGSAAEVTKQIRLISETHYHKQTILVQSILSTHKHHDHTGGNVGLLNKMESIKLIIGGAVEKVPGCNFEVKNGDVLPLPKDGANRMEDCVQVEAVATPGHTRGSITYVLRPTVAAGGLAYLFTGDTMFCGGAGVPFEADIDADQEAKDQKRDFRMLIKASASTHAVERCLVEIVVRSVPLTRSTSDPTTSDRVFLMPGHEYTGELLSRQFSAEANKWKSVTPSTFFETASQFYVALHRRTLPHSSGKLLCAMGSPLERELCINPYLRTVRARGELILHAIDFWHNNFCRRKVPDWIPAEENNKNSPNKKAFPRKTNGTLTQWNLDRTDLNRSVFTTVYSADLDLVIQDLAQGKVSAATAAQRLRDMSKNLNQPTLTRRPVPGTMPSDRSVYRGLLALVLLGSAPNALTYRDAELMNLSTPVKTSNDILISKSRLITILRWLNLISADNEGRRHEEMIRQLWKESMEDSDAARNVEKGASFDTDVESSQVPDVAFLVDLKWSIYGVPRQKPSALSFCLPCAKQPRMDRTHPVHQSGLKPSSGELVRHDVLQCYLCQTMAGCPHMDNQEGIGSDRPVLAQYGSTGTFDEEDRSMGETDGSFVEVSNIPGGIANL